MKNIYCIVGPSGCGKTTLVEALEKEFGYKTIESYTTRPPRFPGETGHIFVSPEEFHSLGDMMAYTTFDGYEYGVTAGLIEQSDLYVIEPTGVEFLNEKYNGSKGVKVICLEASPEVLIERMQKRGDSDEKIIKRLVNDYEAFRGVQNIADITLRTDINTIEELCEAVSYHIECFEEKAKHEFSLLDEHGEVVVEGRRFYTYDDAEKSLLEAYPSGLPDGWSLRDDTDLKRQEYLKEIKKARPSLKSSMIKVDMEDSGVYQGVLAVPFKYKTKEYIYYNDTVRDEKFITVRKPYIAEPMSARERVEFDIHLLQKQMLRNSKNGEPSYSCANALVYLRNALDEIDENESSKTLDAVIFDATNRVVEGASDVSGRVDIEKEF